MLSYIPMLIFKQNFLETFEESFVSGNWANFQQTNIFSVIIMYTLDFFRDEHWEHNKIAELAYFSSFKYFVTKDN